MTLVKTLCKNFMFQTNISKIVHFRFKNYHFRSQTERKLQAILNLYFSSCLFWFKNHHLWPKIDHGEYTTKSVFVFFDSKKPIIWM